MERKNLFYWLAGVDLGQRIWVRKELRTQSRCSKCKCVNWDKVKRSIVFVPRYIQNISLKTIDEHVADGFVVQLAVSSRLSCGFRSRKHDVVVLGKTAFLTKQEAEQHKD